VPTPSAHRRPATVTLVVLATAACLALGWWQWTRYESGSGSFQNLGYALQWPLFAAFVVYAYRRVVALEDADEAAEEDGPTPATTAAGPATEIPADVLPARRGTPADTPADPDDAYLAQLDRDTRRTTP
jgi:DNA-binding transcriptional regulator of glucitol operon